ncbi:GMC-OxRdtase-N domain-containing protein [Mycena chlorophos]|uniref:GMC-OxRdtase-N domain-containing protein n=1 Tax=Mycena chlorophos TaxID=658473 RepID=A0A8H6T545_MYCCL|nr:GMC-OxRdtase-N domain-containing protein [Mycena chlorophos]
MKFSASFSSLLTLAVLASGAFARPAANAELREMQRRANAQALQSSTTLDPSVIQNVDDGQNPPTAGQTAAVVSQNNFINFCAQTLPATPLTNGLQLTTGSCNPTPIGLIPSSDKMPSGKFQNPKNGDTIPANQAFTITLAVKNIQLGDFTNAQQTYFANPQTLNAQGEIIGHTHFVIEAIDSLDSTTVTDPTQFTFFKGVDDAQDADGNVSVNVTAGVPAGTYRMGTIVAASTHQPAIVPIAQHGLLDDVVYFTASDSGAAAGGAGGNNAAAGGAAGNAGAGKGAAAATTAAASTATAAKGQAGKGQQGKGGQAAKGQQGKGGFGGKFGKGRPRF